MDVSLMLFMADLNYVMVLLLFLSFPGDKCSPVCLGSYRDVFCSVQVFLH